MPIEIRKLTTGPEELMARIQALYERSFPPQELRPFDRICQEIAEPTPERRTHLIAALEDDRALGISIFALFPQASLAYLWYICVAPETRGAGIGGKLYQESLECLGMDALAMGLDMKGMIFEVERLDSESHPVYGDPHRRVRFYERLGARLIMGYDYHQPAIPPHDPVPLQLMFHPMKLRQEGCECGALARIVSDFLRLAQGVDDSLDGCVLRLSRLSDLVGHTDTAPV